jgi:hypothetical protein
MDANSNHAEHEYEENPWMLVFDRIYSHHLLWPEVLACSSAIALWMERLVQFEVRDTFSMREQNLTPSRTICLT